MKKTIIILCVFILLSLSSCDPVLPNENISAECTPNPLTVGETAEISVKYPDISNTAIKSWEQPNITIISGDDIVSVSGLSVTGLEKGKATLRIEVVSNCSFMGVIIDKPVYSIDLVVSIK